MYEAINEPMYDVMYETLYGAMYSVIYELMYEPIYELIYDSMYEMMQEVTYESYRTNERVTTMNVCVLSSFGRTMMYPDMRTQLHIGSHPERIQDDTTATTNTLIDYQ